MTKIASSVQLFIKTFIYLSFLIFCFSNQIHAQSLKFKVKLERNFTQTFETLKQSKSSNGYIEYGIPELDSLNERFKVIRMERLFKSSPQFENRHREAGLHRWYEIVVDRNAIESSEEFCVQSYQDCNFISTAEPFYEKVYVDNYDHAEDYEIIQNPESYLIDSNDPLLDQQWHYENTGQTGGTAGADINLKNAWAIESGDSSVVVAIIDGGVDVDHQDLQPNMWQNDAEIYGVDGVDDDGNGYIDDKYGYNFGDNSGTINASDHGTHVAGTVGAVNNNGIGVSGVAGGSGNGDGIRMMSCAVFGDYGTNGFDEAFIYAADNGAVIAQNSWGYTSPGVFEQSVLDAIDYFIANAGRDEYGNVVGPLDGGIVIFASGNSNSSADYYPGFYPPVLSVSSTDHNDIKSSFSNYGDWVDIAAPGSNVLSTFPNNNYSSISGTSMACPHVSGVAALIVSQYPDLTNDGLWNILTNTTDNINDLNSGFMDQLGSGRLNAFTALQSNDGIPPSAIDDLSFIDAEPTKITINWTAPGGSDTVGVASEYDVRYSTSIIDSANFDSADSITNLPYPLPYGESQNFTLTDLNPLTTYFIAIKSKDFYGETSSISNVLTASTTDVPIIRIEPDSLYADMLSGDSITQTLTVFNDGNYPLSFEVGNANYESLNISKINFESTQHQSFQTKSYVSNRSGLFNLSDSIDGDIIYENDFEGDVSDWTIEVYSGDDLWHLTDVNSSSPVNSWNCAIAGGTDYDTGNRINSAVVSPEITLNSISQDSIFLTFRESYQTEGGWDYCMVDITTDNGANWQPLRGTASANSAPNGNSNGWITSKYDLSNYQGETVKLRFYFDTKDGQAQNYPGWFFDDVIVYAGKPKWQSVSLQSAVVNPGSSIELNVIFNSKNLPSGNYKDSLVFISNDPYNPTLNIPTEIDVTGAPGIELSTMELNYDSLFITDTLKKTVQIRSIGTDTLLISDITLNSENFKIDSTSLALAAGSDYELEVSFLPKTIGALKDTLKIFSNDSITPILTVNLMGYGVEPPVMSVSPDSVEVNLMTNDSTVQYITIDNTAGGSSLYVGLDKIYGISEINGMNFSSYDYANSHDNRESIPIKHNKNVASVEKNILVIQNKLAWGVDMVDFIYSQTNITAIGILSSDLGNYDLSNIDLIITTGDQTTQYYDDLTTQVAKLEGFVNNGGVIQYQVATQGEDVQLVGGVGAINGNSENFNIVIDSLHPIVTSLPQLLEGSSANHNYLINLPGNADEIIRTEISDVATLVEYQFGSGKVIATGMTVEFLYSYGGFNSSPILGQILSYSLETSGFDWLKVDVLNDTIPMGSSKDIALNFNSTGLLGGIYNAEITINSNDPVTTTKKIPITMDVTGIPEISISKDTLSFGNIFLGQSIKKSLIINNSGSDLLEINSINSSSSDYAIDSTNFNLAPGQSIELGITYSPTVEGVNNIDLEISSNDSSSLTSIVKLLGEGLIPPQINVDPDSLSIALNSGDSTIENLVIDNSLGGSILNWQIDVININAQPNNYVDFNQNLNEGVNNNNETTSNRVVDNMPLVAGEFTALNNSPVALTAVSINSDRTIIYAFENNGNNFYQYSIENEVWSSLTSSPVSSGNNGGAVELNGKIYHSFTQNSQLAVYDISTDSWSTITSPLSTGNIASDGDYLYLVNNSSLYRFDPNASDFVEMASPGVYFTSWGGLEYYDGYLYSHTGDGSTNFARYNILNNAWELLANIPGGAVLASAMDPYNGKYYTYGSYGGNNWYEYNIDSAQWNVSSIPLFIISDGGMIFSNKGAKNGIYFVQGENGLGFGLFETDLGAQWLSANKINGQVNAGESEIVELTIDASELNGGNYLTEVIISNNDPENEVVKVPVNLEVTGEPTLFAHSDSLVFDPIFVGQSNSKSILVENVGTDLLTVSDVSFDNNDFSVDVSSFELSPNESISLTIEYLPTTEGNNLNQLIFTSNDVVNSPTSIELFSTASLPPVINILEDSLSETLEQNNVSTQTINIDNTTGGSDLNFELSQFSVSTTSAAINSEVFRGEEVNQNTKKTEEAFSEHDIYQQPRDSKVKSLYSQDINLADLLTRLDTAHNNLTNLIPDNYLFSNGFTGTNISDGGGDMYDGGNRLSTDFGGDIYYSNNLIDSSIYLDNNNYFTAKYDGLFIFSADVSAVNSFSINGNLGADGSGSVDGAVIEMTKNGKNYVGFVKRVYNAYDPSVNHLIIVEDNGLVNHEFSTDTNNDFHRLNNLTDINNLHHLLFAGTSGKYYDNTVMTNVMEAYLDLIDTKASWLTMEPSEGTVPAGQQMEIAVNYNANHLEIGNYNAQITVNHNDPTQPQIDLPVSLNVIEEVINEAPIIADQIFRIAENPFSNEIVGQIQASDINEDSLSYRVLNSSAAGAFRLSTSGILSVDDSTLVDFDLHNVIDLSIEVSDGDLQDTAVVSVIIEEVIINEAPVINDQTFRIDENSPNGSLIGQLVAFDPNQDGLIFSMTSSEYGDAIALNTSGILTIADSAFFDYESNMLLDFYVTVFDGEYTDSAEVTIIINDVLENTAPNITGQGFEINENSPLGTEIGSIVANDPQNDNLSYSLNYSNIEGAVALSTTGILTVSDSSIFDYESTSSFEIGVNVSDGEFIDSAVITITILDVVENTSPTINDQEFEINENSPIGTEIGSIIANDVENDSLSYSLNYSNIEGAVAISTSGMLTVADSSIFDYESITSFEIGVNVSDGEFTDSAVIVITILDVNENTGPTINNQTFEVEENTVIGFEIGELVANDSDNDSLSFVIVNAQIEGAFSLSENGVLSVLDSSLINFETHNSIVIIVEVSDGLLTDEGIITIEVIEVEDEVLGNQIMKNNLSLYPNPVRDELVVNYDFQNKTHNLYLIDLTGRRVEIDFNNNGGQVNINTNNLAAGVYQLIIKDGNDLHQARFIKQ
ncbi:S8 family serine peptidase [Marivirga sp.]|uniref:Ig-like domain-containing protein n=1 Tax=Marivirga sp. TaxID=2018662 RepID=UPI00345D5853